MVGAIADNIVPCAASGSHHMGHIDMKTPSFALAALAASVVIGSLASTSQPAAAFNLGFLNKMNPEYRRCVANVRAQVRVPIDRNLHDAIINACNARYPAYGR